MDFEAIKAAAQGYEADMTAFLRDLIRLPGESTFEKPTVDRIIEEMQALGFDEAYVDAMGNAIGFMGSGKTLIAFDAHVDTVGVGNAENWDFDPFEGYENDVEIGGRGASDQLGGIVSAVYGAKIMKDLGLLSGDSGDSGGFGGSDDTGGSGGSGGFGGSADTGGSGGSGGSGDSCASGTSGGSGDYRVMVTGTVQEEDCDGLCWEYIIKEQGIRPEFVVITEPTDGHIYRGQRGRMEIRVEVSGISCHGSAPERGENAIFKMAEILGEVEKLNDRLLPNDFLGKGTLTVSEIFSTSPSRCAVADGCAISIDRRLTDGETWERALEELRELPSVQKHGATVSMYSYDRPSYTGLVYPIECYFPTWVIPPEAPAAQAAIAAYRGLYGEPVVDKWTFSTNGVSIMGRNGIPCIGFGPGKEAQAHAPNEKTWKADLVRCAAVYAAIPALYVSQNQEAL